MSRTLPTQSTEEDFNLYELDRLLDIAKSKVFLGKNSAFFGPVMSQLNFIWTTDIKTAATNGIYFIWNPYFFLRMPEDTRVFIIMHELWHVARLHQARAGNRIWKLWNYACDIRINNDLISEGFTHEGFKPWVDPTVDIPERKTEEEIYDYLLNLHDDSLEEFLKDLADNPFGEDEEEGDLHEDDDVAKQAVITAVTAAVHQATIAQKAGDIPGSVQKILKQFLKSIIPWEQKFQRFFHDLLEQDYYWGKPNRRLLNYFYLPSTIDDDGRLEHLIYYLDVSGSVTDAQVTRFNSELKYIWDTLKPKKLTIVQFDTQITQEFELVDGEDFNECKVVGRGGTDLRPVREHMLEHKPTCAVIFSDLWCEPMEALPFDIPTIWVAIGNTTTPIPFGERINIRG